MDVVLIPAYEPDEMLVELVGQLKKEAFEVLVVDDGSGEGYKHIFDAVADRATVITLPHNCGKGAALKAGMKHILEKMPDCENFITCDADGQHKVEDVVRIREKLHGGEKFVLTVRKARKGIPFRSKIGNSLSRFVYTLLTNRYLSDNQSGLRGFAREHLDWLIRVEKNNYDYEMNVLYYASKKGVRIATLPIESIYIENNKSSHFNPIMDTYKIYKSLFALAGASFIAFAISESVIITASILFNYRHMFVSIPSAAALSFIFTVLLNRFIFFRGTDCYDHTNILIFTIIHYIFYSLGCILVANLLPFVPLAVAFNIVFFLCIPLRYLFHKFIFVASQTRE